MRVCLLIVIPAYLLFIGVESEVRQDYDFGTCKQFFFEGSPPKGFDKDGEANLYVPICQKTNDIPRYATYYDTGTKMPIFSAYKSESPMLADRQTLPEWFIEPQLCDPPNKSGQNMDLEKDCGIAGSYAGQKQAINADYTENQPLFSAKFDKVPLNPDSHNAREEGKLATLTLTNAAPLFSHFNSGTWNRVEQAISALIDTWCPARPVPSCEAYHITGTGFDSRPRHEFSSFTPPHFVWTAVCVRFFPADGEVNFMRFGVIGWNSEKEEGERLELYSLEEFETRLKLLLQSEDVEMFPADGAWRGCSFRHDNEPVQNQLKRNGIARKEALRLHAKLAEFLPQHRTDISTSSAHAGVSRGNPVTYHATAEAHSLKAPTISAPSSSWAPGVGDLLKQLKLACDIRETKCAVTGLNRKKRSAHRDSITVCPGLRSLNDRTRSAGGSQCLHGSHCRKASRDGEYECQVDQKGSTEPCCAPDSPCHNGTEANGDSYGYYWCWTSDKHEGSEWTYCSPPYSSVTVSGQPCIDGHPCGLHGEDYYWCYTDYSANWDYCCAPWSNTCENSQSCYTHSSGEESSPCTSLTQHSSAGSRRRRSVFTPTSDATCPDGWTSFCSTYENDQGSCWCVMYSGTDTKTWEKAQEACQAMEADLASVHSRSEAEFLNELVGADNPEVPWIGLSKRDKASQFQWSDHSPVDYEFRAATGPSENDGANQCAYMHTTAYIKANAVGYAQTVSALQWSYGECEHEEPYFCKKAATIGTAREAERSAEDCPEGWEPHCMRNRDPKCLCYRYFKNERQSWNAASETCKSHGGDLVSVHTMEQVSFLDRLTGEDATAPWLGLFNKNGQWVWSDKSRVDFTQWARGEGNASKERTCAYMYSSGYYKAFRESGRPMYKLVWNAHPCTVPQPFFCQMRPEVPHSRGARTCPNNWKRRCFSDQCKCYESFHEPAGLTWQRAADVCHNEQGQLAAIKSKRENRFVASMMAADGSWAWTGLRTIDGKVSWADRAGRLDYAAWSRQVLLQNWTKYDNLCVMMGTDRKDPDHYMKWTMDSCDSKNVFEFVCELELDPPAKPCDQSMARCPEGWVKQCLEPRLLSCYCYKKVLVPKTWEEATQSCQEEDGYLISLESRKEELLLLHIAKGTEMVMNPSPIGLADRIREMLCRSNNCPRFWIGLRGHNKAWSHGAPINYTNWSYGRDTGCTYFWSEFARWFTMSCSVLHYYVCKKPADIEIFQGTDASEPCLL